MNNKSDLFDEPADFSLALGGPLFQLFRRTRLSGSALEIVGRRTIVITAIAWLPLLLLAALEGHIFGGVQLPFLFVRYSCPIPRGIAAPDRCGGFRS